MIIFKVKLGLAATLLIFSLSSLLAEEATNEALPPKKGKDGSKPSRNAALALAQEQQNDVSAKQTMLMRRLNKKQKASSSNAVKNMDAPDFVELMKLMEPADKTPKFQDWETWPSKYPGCSTAYNKNLSPIKINTSEAIRTDKTTPTLFIYSNTPIGDYFVSPVFQHDSDYIMTALTIKLSSDKLHDATYVTGLGDVSYRLFEYAFFLYSTSNESNPYLSLHRIDNKTFPLEIVMFFTTSRTVDDTTQVHVMVNISKEDNPLFAPVVQAAKQLTYRQNYYDQNKEKATDQLEKVQAMKDTLDDEHEDRADEGFYTTLEHFKDYIDFVKECEDAIQQNTEMMTKTLAIIMECEDGLATEKANAAGVTAQIEEFTDMIKELEAEYNKTEGDDAKVIMKQANQVRADRASIEHHLVSSNNKITSLTNKILSEKNRVLIYQEQISMNQNDITELFEDIKLPYLLTAADATEYYYESLKILGGEQNARMELSKEYKLYRKYLEELSPSVRLPFFQISWLLPAVGGHYIYDGSLPVPPCTQRGFTLVMENAVSISQEQFDTIVAVREIPGLEDMKDCVPILSKPKGGRRKVRYNKKNLQYILDDTVHMKSKLRKKLKDQMRLNQCAKVTANSQFVLTAICVFFLLSRTYTLFCPGFLYHH